MQNEPLRTTMHPSYEGRFGCIGPACEDSCCVGWAVYFDEKTWDKYQAIPSGPLRVLLNHSVKLVSAQTEGKHPGQFARVQMTEELECPFLNRDKLCQIQVEHGEEFLSKMCATYPRVVHRIDGVDEKSLSLSCPEAARVVLLTPGLLQDQAALADPVATEIATIEDASRGEGDPAPLLRHFWSIRAFVLELLGDGRYALWQRLFLLGIFVRRLDALGRGELECGFGALLRNFRAAVASGTLREPMETIAPDLALQLDMVLRLASLRLPRSHVGQRFVDTAREFAAGIGSGPGATMELLVARYAQAYARYYAPFFATRPHVLENLLMNAVFRSLFPFGQTAGRLHSTPVMAREFAFLATHFALIKGLLIGVAGFHGPGFSEAHVIRTVQSASKHFEHHPNFLEEAHTLLAANELDTVRGLTMLVRN